LTAILPEIKRGIRTVDKDTRRMKKKGSSRSATRIIAEDLPQDNTQYLGIERKARSKTGNG